MLLKKVAVCSKLHDVRYNFIKNSYTDGEKSNVLEIFNLQNRNYATTCRAFSEKQQPQRTLFKRLDRNIAIRDSFNKN